MQKVKRRYRYAGIEYVTCTPSSVRDFRNYLCYEFADMRMKYVEWAYVSRGDRAIVALDGDKLVGLWRFSLLPKRRGGRIVKHISSEGTWVHPKYRNRGIAKRLWSLGIRSSTPIEVQVIVASRGGMTLVNVMRKQFPRILFDARPGWGLKARRDRKGNPPPWEWGDFRVPG